MIDWSFLSVPFYSVIIPDSLSDRVTLENYIYSISEENIEDFKTFLLHIISQKFSKQTIFDLLTHAASIRPLSYDLLAQIWPLIPNDQCIFYEMPFTRILSNIYKIPIHELYNKISMECIYPKDSEEYAVAHDDLDKVVQYSINDDFFSLVIDLSIKDCLDLLSFAGFCGSTKVFKFLVVNGLKITQETTEYLVKGGHVELIEYVENIITLRNPEITLNSSNESKEETQIPLTISFDRHLSFAIEFHQNEIAKWLIENYENEDVDIRIPLESSDTFMFLLMIQNGYLIDDSLKETLQIFRRFDLLSFISSENEKEV